MQSPLATAVPVLRRVEPFVVAILTAVLVAALLELVRRFRLLGDVLVVFAETDLRNAHMIARRLSAVMRHTSHGKRDASAEPTVSVATLLPQDEAGYYRPEYRRDYEDRGPQLRLNFCRRDDRGRTEIIVGRMGGAQLP